MAMGPKPVWQLHQAGAPGWHPTVRPRSIEVHAAAKRISVAADGLEGMVK